MTKHVKSKSLINARESVTLVCNLETFEDRTLLLLVAVISLAFAWILWPFSGAILWAIIIAILFAPMYRRLSRAMGPRRNLAALAMVLVIVSIVIFPLALIGALVVQEARGLYDGIQSGELDLGRSLQQIIGALPSWAPDLLNRFGLTNLGSVLERLSAVLMKGGEFFATQAVNIGQNTLDFILSLGIMLYLLFFLLRDGEELSRRLREAIPLRPEQQRALFEKFAMTIRATVKGDILVAIVQGALGGIIFWILEIRAALLWAVLMALLSLLPMVGAALVWLPVAIYLMSTGAVWGALF